MKDKWIFSNLDHFMWYGSEGKESFCYLFVLHLRIHTHRGQIAKENLLLKRIINCIWRLKSLCHQMQMTLLNGRSSNFPKAAILWQITIDQQQQKKFFFIFFQKTQSWLIESSMEIGQHNMVFHSFNFHISLCAYVCMFPFQMGKLTLLLSLSFGLN